MAHINRKTRSITFTVIKFLGSLNRLNQTSLGHYGSLSPQFLTHFIFLYASPIWIQKKRSTYFAGWFVSARYLTFSLTNSGPHRIVTCIGIASLLTSQQISRNFWIWTWSFRNRNFLIEIPPECHAVLNLWIHCHFRMAFDSF